MCTSSTSFYWISLECSEPVKFSCSYIWLFCCIWGCFSWVFTSVIISTAVVHTYPTNSCIVRVVLWSLGSVAIIILFSHFFHLFVLSLWIQRQLLKCVLHMIYFGFCTVIVYFIWVITNFSLQLFILSTIFYYIFILLTCHCWLFSS